MAPEVLDFIPDAENNVFIEENFQCFLNSDIYSLGLVLWEISSRTIVDGKSYKYKSPNQGSTNQSRSVLGPGDFFEKSDRNALGPKKPKNHPPISPGGAWIPDWHNCNE